MKTRAQWLKRFLYTKSSCLDGEPCDEKQVLRTLTKPLTESDTALKYDVLTVTGKKAQMSFFPLTLTYRTTFWGRRNVFFTHRI